MESQRGIIPDDGRVEPPLGPRRRPIDLGDAMSWYGLLATWILLIVVFSIARPEIF